MSDLQLPPLSLYVHIPWCERKCPYCDFNSHEPQCGLPERAYVEALLRDLDDSLHYVKGRELLSIFIGGGTPSLFSIESIASLLRGIRQRLSLTEGCEITLEANPGSAEAEKFAGFADAGVNRLSLGIQSFSDSHLEALGRVHNADQAHAAVEMASASGVSSINIDLMHGLPGQSRDAAALDLQRAIACRTDHLSWYQLTIERNTAFYKNPPLLPIESELGDIQDHGENLIAAAGFENYEVSAYSQPGQLCRHNLNYWEFGDYLGIGAGAHGKISVPEQNLILRTTKRKQPEGYLANSEAKSVEIAEQQRVGDFMLNALRLSAGVDTALFSARTGLRDDAYSKTAEALASKGLLTLDGNRIATTDLGRRFLDSVVSEFL